MKSGFWMTVKDFAAQVKKQGISAHAASTAFFLFLSLVPMLMVLCSVIPYTPLTEANLIKVITDITPDMFDPVAESLVAEVYAKSTSVLSVALLATIWSAAKGVMALMNGLNAINNVEEERNYFVVRAVASCYTIVMLIGIILSLIIVVFGNQLVSAVLHRVQSLQEVLSFLMNFRFLFVWLILTVLFCMVYTYIPNCKLKFREQLWGAMFSAIVWSIFSWGFSVYVDYGRVGSIYGSLTVIVMVMLWMYFCMYLFFIGAYFNRYFNQSP